MHRLVKQIARVHTLHCRRLVRRDLISGTQQSQVPEIMAPKIQAPDGDFSCDSVIPDVVLSGLAAIHTRKPVQMSAYHGPAAVQGVVARDKHGLDVTHINRVDTERDAAHILLHQREVHGVQQILHRARAARSQQAAVLICAQSSTAHRASHKAHVSGECEGPCWAQELQLAVQVERIIYKDRVPDVPCRLVCKVLGLLPVHSVRIVDADKIHEGNVTHGVLANKHVVPIELILNHIGWHHPVVPTLRCKLSTAAHICDKTIVVPLQVARVLVVQIKTKSLAVMVHVSSEGSKRCVLRTNPVQSHSLSVLGN
mmetsp:Transcript_33320/g.59826  ORF Transcript_33320/g.59826 Transcript_33320/m.59826 type:complete len:312 (+) Transcript_33320:273-1208(+)